MKFLIVLIVLISIAIQTFFGLHPRRRVCTWFEFLTDGYMPDDLSNIAQDTIGELWKGGFSQRAIQRDDEISHNILRYLNKWNSDNFKLIIEIAAGRGVAPVLWRKELIELQDDDADIRVLLTDLQPNLKAWRRLGPNVEYVNSSIDATNLNSALSEAGVEKEKLQGSLRMIHFALHHFCPTLVKSIFSDVISSHSAILVGDLDPNPGGVVWLNFLGALRMGTIVRDGKLKEIPLWCYPFLPILPFLGFHDGAVSVLRAYSAAELREIVQDIPGSEMYQISTYYSKSYAKWLGLPGYSSKLFSYLGLNDPVVQFFILEPK